MGLAGEGRWTPRSFTRACASMAAASRTRVTSTARCGRAPSTATIALSSRRAASARGGCAPVPRRGAAQLRRVEAEEAAWRARGAAGTRRRHHARAARVGGRRRAIAAPRPAQRRLLARRRLDRLFLRPGGPADAPVGRSLSIVANGRVRRRRDLRGAVRTTALVDPTWHPTYSRRSSRSGSAFSASAWKDLARGASRKGEQHTRTWRRSRTRGYLVHRKPRLTRNRRCLGAESASSTLVRAVAAPSPER